MTSTDFVYTNLFALISSKESFDYALAHASCMLLSKALKQDALQSYVTTQPTLSLSLSLSLTKHSVFPFPI